ncbi:Mtw1 kinetochore complex, DSN1 [Cordyceps fumosorosea ARSEF 2679]|uniref:Mtw1 kinetochore complex, DSN1 n=1 Tax=Cordyceps fumosorosea (strain ARSEF 2679) TaxID=1081104 RepID=A0A167NDM1_CORFA|nr:Mtw1 kinetochore complex, DSN1 [Cordyceps fumosorosea ARSEF 2679]OAA55436.1 Mtw1 kinetochore complex, DSN1 [Cordyceps fumosorosea ARSEF 2679]
MTTLVATRTSPLDLSMSNQPDRRTGKRLAGEQGPGGRAATKTTTMLIRERAAAEDFEDDDGFVFTRKPKKARTDEVAATATAPVRRSPRNKPAAGERSTAATTTTKTTIAAAASTSQRRTGTAAASPSRDADRTRREASAGRATASSSDPKTSRRGDADDKPRRPERSTLQSPPRGTTTITLPTSDTPVIARNKEMRKKAAEGTGSGNSSSSSSSHRRSSFEMRGRRASSLIESGQTAMPHRDVDARDFYKHIAADGLSEPLRMKQLLTWCGARALPEKPKQGVPSTDPSLGARAILDELTKEFSTRPEFYNWFGRDESVAPATRVLKPNPRNMELDKKMASLEARIQRLREEKNAWLSIQKPSADQPQLFPLSDDTTQETPPPPPQLPAVELLDADEGRVHRYLASELEPLTQARTRARARLRAARGSAGTRDMPVMEVLRGLGRLLPEGGGGSGS